MGISVFDLQINPRIISALRRAGIVDGDAVLKLSGAELEQLAKISSGDVAQVKDAVVHYILRNQKVKTALQIWLEDHHEADTQIHKLSTGCEKLDRALRGGLLARGLIEISGESASGKTQLCLQMCIVVQLPYMYGGLSGEAVYVCTEGAFPSKRLLQMSQCFAKQYHSIVKHSFTDFVYLEHVADLESLESCIRKKLPRVLDRGRVKLVVIDSIAALFRCHYDVTNMSGRSRHIASLATHLRYLADHYKIIVVCINQVTANMSKLSDSIHPTRQSVPALGLVWADHIMCRLLMSRPENCGMPSAMGETEVMTRAGCDSVTAKHAATGSCPKTGEGSGVVTKRQLEVVFAPHLAPAAVPLFISHAGVSGEESCTESLEPAVHYTYRRQ